MPIFQHDDPFSRSANCDPSFAFSRQLSRCIGPVALTAIFTMALLSSGCSVLQKSKESIAGGLKRGKEKAASSASDEDPLDPLAARSPRRLLLDDFSPGQLGTTLKTNFANSKDQQVAQASYDAGKQLYDRGTAMIAENPEGTAHESTFEEAANAFRKASAAWPDSSLAEDAYFLEGESYFFANRYVQANRAFEGLISLYSGSRYLDRAEQRRYSIALYWLELKKNGASIALNDPKRPKFSLAGEARRILHRIRIDDPTGQLADDATFTLGNAYLQAERFEEAADTFSYLRNDYPGSEYQFKTQMLELESLLKSYKGSEYDGLPLVKAEKLRTQIARQFPDKARQNQEILAQQSSLITNQLAQRDYEVGQFYERRGENRAAKIYYEKVRDEHPSSVFENDLNSRIEMVASKPPVPKPTAQWLQDIFPDPEAEKAIMTPGNNEPTMFR